MIQDNRGQGIQQTAVMQDPFPHQGVVSTQQQPSHSHPSGGNSHNNYIHNIFMTEEYIFLQNENIIYEYHLEPNISTLSIKIPIGSLSIP